MGSRAHPLIVLVAVPLLVAVLGGPTALAHLAIGAGPLLAIAGLLLAGRYPGERVVLALARRRGATLRAALSRTWSWPRATASARLACDRTLTLRGPPRAPAAA